MTYTQYRNYLAYVLAEYDQLTDEEKAEKIKAVALAKQLRNDALKRALKGGTLDIMTPAQEEE